MRSKEAYLGDDVDERVGDGGQELHSVERSGRRDQGHIGEGCTGTLLSEGNSFLRREIDHDESICTSLGSIMDRLFLAIGNHWVVVTCKSARVSNEVVQRSEG